MTKMCGICGIFAIQTTEQHNQIVNSILTSQLSRGPDHQASVSIQGKQSQVILGHNRLSIVDLSAQANQPMWNNSNRYCISFNGEIYNYIELRDELRKYNFEFTTNSDTEVILHAFAYWGIAALQRFHGPFSFAIFDKETDELWLCRDRFGVRPLYYAVINNILYFASSTSILAKTLNLKPNLSYVAKGLKYLVYEDNSDISPYENILSLPPASYLRVKFDFSGKLSQRKNIYYNLADNVQDVIQTLPADNIDSLLQLINETFEQAVRVRLRMDVPMAISISSGLDSSSVAALVSRNHQDTMGFSFADPYNKKSEGPLVAKCAKFLGIKIEYVWPKQDEMIEALFKTITAQDSPFASLSIVAQYLLYKQVNACGIKVLLGGQGGDESFMGYRKFLLFWIQHLLKQKRYFATAKNLLQLLPMLTAEISSLGVYWRHRHRYKNGSGLTNVLQLPLSPLLHLNNSSDNSLKNRQIQDITQFSLPTLLRYEDRNAMAHSVESRLPFLDHRLIELGVALPEAIKLRAGYGKWPIREIMRDKIPDQIRLAKFKRGFDIPLTMLLKAGLGRSIRAALQENQQTVKEFLKQPAEINHLFSDHQLMQRQSAIAEAITLLWLNKSSL
jgi:asparagine synthase (glutamine-hydrolysing)